VIATAVGGSPEPVADGSTGLLVPPDDPPALAAAIVGVLGSTWFMNALGDAAQRRVADRFTRERMVAATLSLYERILEPRGTNHHA
jgi:glycosyltransferase involved in cell wall biosynthesis